MNKRTITVVAYQDNWPALFEREKALLSKVLVPKNLVAIHHIGSTSVKGLAAKPVIDILIEVNNIENIAQHNDALASMGFIAKGENGISGRRYFQKGGNKRSHHLHIFERGNQHVINHLRFRNYLRSNAQAAQEYSKIKKQAALACENDPVIYMQLKGSFISQVLATTNTN